MVSVGNLVVGGTAKTPLAAIFAGLLLMVIVLFVAPLLAYLPNAAMAGILFLVAFGIIDFKHIRAIVRASRSDSMVLWGTFLATLFLQLDFAIMLGVFLSLAIYLHRASRPRVRVLSSSGFVRCRAVAVESC